MGVTGVVQDVGAAPWAGLARFPLAVGPTPLVRAPRLEAALGLGPTLVKRDDLLGFGVAGNKTRPLEFLIGAAVAQGARVFVTGGGPGSNFCAAAAMAARAAGLACELHVWGDPRSANLALATAAGATLVPTGGTVREQVDEQIATRVAQLGDGAYGVPRGGSTPLGAVGFAAGAAELAAQLDALDVRPGLITLPVGSGGSVAGLMAGLAAVGLDIPVLGVSVSRPLEEIRAKVDDLAAGCAALLGTPAPDPAQLTMVDARGPGFGSATDRERMHAREALWAEGLLLDETYGAEAFSAVVDLVDRPEGPVLWWHTGGLLPALGSILKGPA